MWVMMSAAEREELLAGEPPGGVSGQVAETRLFFPSCPAGLVS
jgi:hypothetical protein